MTPGYSCEPCHWARWAGAHFLLIDFNAFTALFWFTNEICVRRQIAQVVKDLSGQVYLLRPFPALHLPMTTYASSSLDQFSSPTEAETDS